MPALISSFLHPPFLSFYVDKDFVYRQRTLIFNTSRNTIFIPVRFTGYTFRFLTCMNYAWQIILTGSYIVCNVQHALEIKSIFLSFSQPLHLNYASESNNILRGAQLLCQPFKMFHPKARLLSFFLFAVSANGKETRKKDPTKSRSSSTKPRKIVESSSMEFEQWIVTDKRIHFQFRKIQTISCSTTSDIFLRFHLFFFMHMQKWISNIFILSLV